MKISEHTAERLVIVERPWLGIVACLLLAPPAIYGGLSGSGGDDVWARLALVAAGLGLLGFCWWYLGFLTIVFDRVAGEVSWTVGRVGRDTRRSVALSDVQGIELESGTADYEGTKRLVLKTRRGAVPLETSFNSFDRTRFAKTIEDWLKGPSTSI